MKHLTHINTKGEAKMVDIATKKITIRIAKASCEVLMKNATLKKIQNNSLKKGDVLATARIAGIMAAKKTATLIPLCHQLNLTKVSIDFEFTTNGIKIIAITKLTAQTGVEMEALTACSIAALTIYDMAKAIDRFMQITNLQILEKSGGKSGDWKNEIS